MSTDENNKIQIYKNTQTHTIHSCTTNYYKIYVCKRNEIIKVSIKTSGFDVASRLFTKPATPLYHATHTQ